MPLCTNANTTSNNNNNNTDGISSHMNIKFPCLNCKKSCDETNCILCDYCSNWYHDECTILSRNKLAQHSTVCPDLKKIQNWKACKL